MYFERWLRLEKQYHEGILGGKKSQLGTSINALDTQIIK